MKKCLVPAGFLILGLVVLAGYYRMRNHYDQLLSLEAEQQSQQKEVQWSFKVSGNEFTIDGKKQIVDFVNADTANVDVKRENAFKMKDNHVYLSFVVTIKGVQPWLLSKDSYAKIEPGMTYTRVAEVLGGSMTKGKMTDSFYGKLELVQGKRQIDLSFEDGKVADKSARDLE